MVPKLSGRFTGLVIDRTSKAEEERNTELILLLEEALEPWLGVTLGSDDAVIVDVIRNAASGRSAIKRIGRILSSGKALMVGPERRPLTMSDLLEVMVLWRDGAGMPRTLLPTTFFTLSFNPSPRRCCSGRLAVLTVAAAGETGKKITPLTIRLPIKGTYTERTHP